MSRSYLETTVGIECFPRVSGDEPDLLRAAASLRGFSPRERG